MLAISLRMARCGSVLRARGQQTEVCTRDLAMGDRIELGHIHRPCGHFTIYFELKGFQMYGTPRDPEYKVLEGTHLTGRAARGGGIPLLQTLRVPDVLLQSSPGKVGSRCPHVRAHSFRRITLSQPSWGRERGSPPNCWCAASVPAGYELEPATASSRTKWPYSRRWLGPDNRLPGA